LAGRLVLGRRDRRPTGPRSRTHAPILRGLELGDVDRSGVGLAEITRTLAVPRITQSPGAHKAMLSRPEELADALLRGSQ
jgi:hypothetical protein